ncbi:hypothetical protein HCN44_003181 [Aphidius gifuensis]|uniref:General transcription factor IIH subunit 1 n=1 Tax=Aphidius gifuensis TaxID=684658 RepID=A0A835CK36_APHGI|nr:general transcription factor IIH subunit 1 [Aphidius gifuensis]KAF7987419.1 hypothetical protein HCN44_003181 [Aphidius gifuensis]
MTTSSEDVLLQVGQVRYKKGDGTLYVMNERIAWMLDNRDTVSLSHMYSDIKTQKISPDGKAKIQLQLVLRDNTSTTFHFVNKSGVESQIEDRNKVKDWLQRLLPDFKNKLDKELEDKAQVLKSNAKLLQLYHDLVKTNVITPEEFWSQYVPEYTVKNTNQSQEIGVNGAFLADIKPQTDGCNGLKYNLTHDIIKSIFKTYPAVKKKFSENVPNKMTEQDFWTKFFQSHYFHRDRINAGTKDLFTECAKIDDQELKKDIQCGINDPLVDITSFIDKTIDAGYGCGNGDNDRVSGNNVHQSMIKRFNQHSIMVMKTSTVNNNNNKTIETINNTNNNIKNNGLNIGEKNKLTNVSFNNNEPKNKKLRIQEKLIYDDLDTSHDVNLSIGVPLNLTHVDRYLHGPIAGQVGGGSGSATTTATTTTTTSSSSEDVDNILEKLKNEAGDWLNGSNIPRSSMRSLLCPQTAVLVLGELTPGGLLMKGYREDHGAHVIPKELEKELRSVYVSILELLKKFWKCFPPTTPQLEANAVKMHETLSHFHTLILNPFEVRVQQNFSASVNQNLTHHLNQLLNTAYRKFAVWQQRKMQHR